MLKLLKKNLSKEIVISFLVVVSFVLSSYLSIYYTDKLEVLASTQGSLGSLFYILIIIFAIVVAPVSTFPLLPVAVGLWGSFNAAIFSIIGWTIGAVIAFCIAKWGGRPLLIKFLDLKKVDKFSSKIPQTNLFFSVILLRMIVPVDILSYAIGLFTPMKLGSYFLATLIGVTPFAFIFSYSIQLPLQIQITGGAIGVLILVIGYKVKTKKPF